MALWAMPIGPADSKRCRIMPGPIIIIPARLAANRLPGKPLADICGTPMIVHVWRRALEANVGPVIVATDSDAIAAVVRAAGGTAVLTRCAHISGSDRIFEALQSFDAKGDCDVVINLQGDLPAIAPADLAAVLAPLAEPSVDIATLAAPLASTKERDDPNVVKVAGTPVAATRLRALYFSRDTTPRGDGPHYHHIGVYAYRRKALERFVASPPSALEAREKLEQLRALEAGMRIDVELVENVAFGVDTPADLERARALMSRPLMSRPLLGPK
jgi:3-deoxy-manno-octulosonate cytidylyltransferase (CMP-KDO synthetase)